eukprot:3278697-Lingulodinium_polyedra.AAC.1
MRIWPAQLPPPAPGEQRVDHRVDTVRPVGAQVAAWGRGEPERTEAARQAALTAGTFVLGSRRG